MWQNSHLPDLYSNLPQPQTYGWNISSDGTFAIDWEAPEVQEKIHTNIQILTKGCHCKTGCKSKVCGCRKKLRYCGPGCDCHSCTNLPSAPTQDDETENETESDGESSQNETMPEIEIITDDFMFSVPDIV